MNFTLRVNPWWERLRFYRLNGAYVTSTRRCADKVVVGKIVEGRRELGLPTDLAVVCRMLDLLWECES